MKKMFVLAVAVTLAVPALAFGAATAGKYTGSITSVLPDLNGKTVTADVKTEGTSTVATVTYPTGDKEVWTWNDKTLDQKELDKDGKVVKQYGATATMPGTYNVNCKDKTKNMCDGDSDSRFYWMIKTAPDSITYQVYGVSKDKKTDPTARAEKRHEFAFKLAK